MEIQEAIKVIRALADGVHPETRESLHADSICRNPQAVMALNRALAALVTQQDRHRGGGHPPTPATPPCVRVRTRRFELVTLAFIDQCWKSERFEVSIGKPHREGFGPSQIPRAESAAGRVVG